MDGGMSKITHRQLMIFCGLVTTLLLMLVAFTIHMDISYREQTKYLHTELQRTQLQLAELKRYISYGASIGD